MVVNTRWRHLLGVDDRNASLGPFAERGCSLHGADLCRRRGVEIGDASAHLSIPLRAGVRRSRCCSQHQLFCRRLHVVSGCQDGGQVSMLTHRHQGRHSHRGVVLRSSIGGRCEHAIGSRSSAGGSGHSCQLCSCVHLLLMEGGRRRWSTWPRRGEDVTTGSCCGGIG